MNMNRVLLRLLVVSMSLISGFSLSVHAETFSDYVSACKSQLGISSIPQFSCKDIEFRQPTDGLDMGLDFGQSNDYVAHRAINNSVDAVFACRWVEQNQNPGRAVSGEMIVHNRSTGGTCYFDMKDLNENAAYPEVNINPVSPTSSTASSVWEIPASTCTDCHSAGPYIASPEIVGALSEYGLINDGHDVINKKYYAVGSSNSQLATRLNQSIQTATLSGCSAQCHSIGGTPKVPSIIGAGLVFGNVVMPSINYVIDEVLASGYMKPDDPYSDYRWINRDGTGGSGDWESLADLQEKYPQFYCRNPVLVQAHVVDNDYAFAATDNVVATDDVTQLPDELEYFNLREGLVCRNADQVDGHQCHDYSTRYICNGTWTPWYDRDNSSGTGDWERRAELPLPCDSPTAIEARTSITTLHQVGSSNGVPIYGPVTNTYKFHGPNDRLRYFDTFHGLACVNDEQVNGESCSNYVVRFICPN